MSFLDDIKRKIEDLIDGDKIPEISMETLERYIEFPKMPELPEVEFPTISSEEDMDNIETKLDQMMESYNMEDMQMDGIKIKALDKIDLPVVGSANNLIGGYSAIADKVEGEHPLLAKAIRIGGRYRRSRLGGAIQALEEIGVDMETPLNKLKSQATTIAGKYGIKIPSFNIEEAINQRVASMSSIDDGGLNIDYEKYAEQMKTDPEGAMAAMQRDMGLDMADYSDPKTMLKSAASMMGLDTAVDLEGIDVDLDNPDLKGIASALLDKTGIGSKAWGKKFRANLGI